MNNFKQKLNLPQFPIPIGNFLPVQTNDMMLAIYLSSIIRSVLALHHLIDNKERRLWRERAAREKSAKEKDSAGKEGEAEANGKEKNG